MGVRTTLSVAAFVCATLCSAAKPPRPAAAVDPAAQRSHPPFNRAWSPPLPPPPLIQGPSSVSGLEDTPIPLGITVDQSLIDGGSLPDIIGTATGHRSATAGATPNTFTIPAGTTSIRVTAYGGYNTGTVAAQSEEWQQVTSTIDLVSNTYSGYLFYALSIGNIYTASYSFSGRPLGAASNAGPIVGYIGTVIGQTPAITASVSGNTLSLVQNQVVTDQSYFIEFLSATDRSLAALGTQGAIQNPTGGPAATSTFTLDPETDVVVLNMQEGRGTSNANDEERGMGRVVIDLGGNSASGNVFQVIGAGDANTVAYGFTNYSITSGTPVLSSGATLAGDVTGAAAVLPNLTITRIGQQLSVTRPAGVASGFTALINLEEYERRELGSAALFTGTSSASAVLSTFAGVLDTASFNIPQHSQFGVMTLGMTSNQNAPGDVENAGSAQIFIDLVQQTTSGSFAVMRASTPDLMVWSNVPFGTMMFGAPGSLSNQSTFAAFTDEYPAVLKFDLITNANGSRSLRMTARPTTINNSTPTYQNYRFTAQTAWAGRPLIEVFGVPVGGTLSAGELNPITQTWTVDPADLPSLAFTPPAHYSGQGVTLTVRYLALQLDIPVNVVRVADPPTLATTDLSGPEDIPLPMNGAIVPALVDGDGSETIDRIRISGLPIGHTLSDGPHVFTSAPGNQTVDVQGWSLSALSYQPPAEYNGSFPLQVNARTTDSDGFSATPDTASTSRPLTITIAPVNDAPVGGDDGFSMNEGGTLTAQSVTGNDSDLDHTNGQLTWNLVNGGSAAANGTLAFNPDGSFAYTPNPGYNGTVSFIYGVCDPGPLCDNMNTVTITIMATNDAPVGNDDAFSMNEDGAITAQSVTGNDNDPDNTAGQLTWSLVSGGTAAANGTLVFNPNGTFNYTPNTNYNGTVSFTYGVCDPAALCDNTNTVTITIAAVNDAPIAGDDSFSTNEDAVLTAQSVTGNDADVDNSTAQLTWSLANGGTAAANGTLVLNANGTFNYTPNANFNGTVSFTYRVCDPAPACDNSNTVTITVSPLNDAPVAGDDSFNMNEDAALTAQSVTSNDGDIDNTAGQLTWSLVSGGTAAANGTLVFNANGTFNYAPAANFNGAVSFTYQVCDPSALCDNTNTVTINIASVNDAPIAGNDGFTVNEDGTLTAQSVTGNDSDADHTNAQLTWSLVSGGTATTNGTLVFNANGTFDYTPNADLSGSVSFTYRVCDPAPACDNTNTVTIAITPVNDPPVAGHDSFTMNEDGALTAQSVTANDADVDNSAAQLTWSLVNGGTAAANGTLVLNSNGTFNYTPNVDFNGTVSFTYRVCDPAPACDNTNTVTIVIAPVNDAPVGNDDLFTMNEEATLTAQSVAGNDTDADNTAGQLTWSLVNGGTAAANGTLVFNANGTFNYTPNANFNGTVSFTYRVCDPATLCDNSTTVTINVNGVNDAPVAGDDTFNMNEDAVLTAQSVATNDGDIDNTSAQLTWSLVNGGTAAANGTLVFNTNGTFTYTPAANHNGTVAFTYGVCDPGGLCDNTNSVTIVIAAVNDAPVAGDDGFNLEEDGTLTAQSVTANDGDVDNTNAQLTWSLVSGGTAAANGTLVFNANGTFNYTPTANFNGIVSFTYRVCDPAPLCDNSTTVTINVNGVNNAPLGGDDSFSMNEDALLTAQSVTGNDNDIDHTNAQLTWSLVSGGTAAANGTLVLNANGTFNYTPAANFNGTVSFTYRVCDPLSACDNSNTVTITVNPVNDAPVGGDDSFTLNEDAALTAQSVMGNDSDIDNTNAQLTWSLVNGGSAAANGTLVLNANGTFNYAPAANFNGTVSFTYRVCDAAPACDNSNTVTITVNPVNDAPVAGDDNFSLNEDAALTAQSVMGNDSDIDNTNAQLTWTLMNGGTAAANGLLTFSNGTFNFTPNNDFNGTVSFTYRVCDPSPACDNTNTVTITVNGINDAPSAGDDGFSMNEDGTLTAQSVTANDTDVDNSTAQLTWSLANGGTAAANGTLVLNANGTFNYTPNADFNGTVSFTYRVCDPAPLCDNTTTVTITVNPVNDAPVAGDDSFTMNEDAALTAQSVTINDSDIDNTNAQLTWSLVSGGTAAANGTLVLNANGTFNYAPTTDFNGTVSFTYRVCDPATLCDNTNTATIVVAPVNDAPIVLNDQAGTLPGAPVTHEVIANDNDALDGSTIDPTSVTLIDGPAHGDATVGPDGSITYTPDAGYVGMDTITYSVCDSGVPMPARCGTAVLVITITNAYPAAASDAFNGTEDMPMVLDVMTNDATPTGSLVPGSVTVTTPPAHGTTSVNAAGEVLYTPDAHYNGTDGLTYSVCNDLGYCSTTTVGIILQPVNDAPIALNDTASTNEDMSLMVDPSINDSDLYDVPAGGIDVLSTDINSDPVHGTAEVMPDGRILYTPAADFNGTDSLTYTICDLGEPLPASCASATVILHVLPMNDAPVITDTEGEAIDTLDIHTSEDVATTICLPHSEADGEAVTVWVMGAGPMHGQIAPIAAGDSCFTYTPDPGYNGPDLLSVALCDASGACDTLVVTLDVEPVNDAPVVVDSFGQPTNTVTIGTEEDQPVIVCLKAIDPESDALDVSDAASGPLNGTLDGLADGDTCFTYMPAPDFQGTDTLTIVVCDSQGACDTVQVLIEVAPVNDAPVVTAPDGTSLDTLYAEIVSGAAQEFCLAASDVDGDALQRTLSVVPQHGDVTGLSAAQDCFTYTADPDLIGYDTLTVSVCDPQGACDQVVVIITLTNQPPQPMDDEASTAMNTAVNIPVLGNDSDPEGSTLTIAQATALHGEVTIEADGTLTYAPDNDYCGPDTITYTVCDPVPQCAQAIVAVSVECPAEDLPPVLVDDGVTVGSGTPVIIDVLANDHDPEGASLTTMSAAASHGSVSINPDGTLYYTPDNGFCGTDTIQYSACDATPLCSTAMVLVEVTCASTSELRIPEGLTPNGDGHNDTWTIQGLERYPNAGVVLFDRWGMEVFRAAPYRNDWNGHSVSGIGSDMLPSGTYWYILDLNTGDGATRTGYVHIIK